MAKLSETQANQLLYVKSRADFLTTAMRDINPTAYGPIDLINQAVKEFEQRLTM